MNHAPRDGLKGVGVFWVRWLWDRRALWRAFDIDVVGGVEWIDRHDDGSTGGSVSVQHGRDVHETCQQQCLFLFVFAS